MTAMPMLETERLHIRPLALDDLEAVHQILDVELAEADFGSVAPTSLEDRREWLHWTIMSYEQYARLYQPPYGEWAVTLKQSGELIGLVGFVPCLMPFEQMPGLAPSVVPPTQARATAEFGLYYAISPKYQRQGYATEATRAMVEYAFQQLGLKRMVATTTYDNAGSMGVMRRLGMRIEKNPYPDPPWLQVVGVLENLSQ
jgi:RimJ/RimL family protein N-acetyltransferase